MSENLAENQILVYSTVWCPDCKRAKKLFGEQRVPYVNIDIEVAMPPAKADSPNVPLRIMAVNCSWVRVLTNGRGLGTAGVTDVAGEPVRLGPWQARHSPKVATYLPYSAVAPCVEH